MERDTSQDRAITDEYGNFFPHIVVFTGQDGRSYVEKREMPVFDQLPEDIKHELRKDQIKFMAALSENPHPNLLIPSSFTTEVDGRVVATFPFIEDGTISNPDPDKMLAVRLQRGEVSPPKIIGIMQQICDAIKHMHGLGFTHGDIALRNILLTADGKPIVFDYDTVTAIQSSDSQLLVLGYGDPRKDARDLAERFCYLTCLYDGKDNNFKRILASDNNVSAEALYKMIEDGMNGNLSIEKMSRKLGIIAEKYAGSLRVANPNAAGPVARAGVDELPKTTLFIR
jgi:serine/threonine protein kinase